MRFRGDYFFLSNFYPCDIKIGSPPLRGLIKEVTFKSSENAYHFFRTDDLKAQNKFISLSPKGAKQLAKRCKTKPNWDDIKLGIMYYVCKQKFTQNMDLANELLDTGNILLVEHNWWGDTFWGVCNGMGENHLGRILMKIRREL